MSRARDAVRALRPRLSILFVVHAGSGGLILTSQDLMRALAPRHDCYVLACGPNKWVLSRADGAEQRLEEVKFAENWKGGAPMSADRVAAFADMMRRYAFDIVHVHSLLGSGPELLIHAREGGRRVVLSFHDFTPICPTINLLDSDMRYCAGSCTPGDTDCAAPQKWFADIDRLKHAYVHVWRERMSRALGEASAFVAPSRSAAALLGAHFPGINERMHIIEHGRDMRRLRIAHPPAADARTRLVVLGVIGQAKGRDLLARLTALNAERGAPFAFHLLGAALPPLPQMRGLVVHGGYAREALPDLLGAIAPSLALLPAQWPETYSHTLTEAWACGIPVLASDLGAPAERIRRHGGGWLIDSADTLAWWRQLEKASRDIASWRAKRAEIENMSFPRTGRMAAEYERLYRRTARG